ncbi:hypothetical protein B0T17DRAFT_503223 [Bombardia bombarda]|uniref:Uncharacterized protein n=1 Tax=Bombardia bombarda TaxID=252184 RepID=A0AA39XKJ5_9PEZI|nr:hypothetical protein B0T17DRAFT_503223 [Bombardia bombarda]
MVQADMSRNRRKSGSSSAPKILDESGLQVIIRIAKNISHCWESCPPKDGSFKCTEKTKAKKSIQSLCWVIDTQEKNRALKQRARNKQKVNWTVWLTNSSHYLQHQEYQRQIHRVTFRRSADLAQPNTSVCFAPVFAAPSASLLGGFWKAWLADLQGGFQDPSRVRGQRRSTSASSSGILPQSPTISEDPQGRPASCPRPNDARRRPHLLEERSKAHHRIQAHTERKAWNCRVRVVSACYPAISRSDKCIAASRYR